MAIELGNKQEWVKASIWGKGNGVYINQCLPHFLAILQKLP